MDVIDHFRVKTAVDSEARGELFLEIGNPIPSILEIFPGERIGAAEVGATHATRPTVIDTDFRGIDEITSGKGRHGNLP
jgi:hypothetical protein